MKISCETARDLMTLCAGDSASPDTVRMLEKHMGECGECRNEYARLRRELAAPCEPISQTEEHRQISGLRRRIRRKRLIVALIASLVTAALIFAGGMAYMHVSAVTDFFTPVQVVTVRDASPDQWQELQFEGGWLMLDGLFSKMEVTSYVDNPGRAELRFTDENGVVVLDNFSIQPNESAVLPGLKKGERYKVEVLADGHYFFFNFH